MVRCTMILAILVGALKRNDMKTYDEIQLLTEAYGFVNVTMLDDLRICITIDYEDGCQVLECEDGRYNVNELIKYLEPFGE